MAAHPATVDALADTLPHVKQLPLAGQARFATHTAPVLLAQSVSEFLRA